MVAELVLKELSFKIYGILFAVHNELSRYCREKQYGDLLEKKLKGLGIKYTREVMVGNSGNIVDFIIENEIVLELKAKPVVLKDDYYQLQRYLQSLNIKLGFLVNFRNKYLKPIRIIRIDTDNKNKFTSPKSN